jgi:hypothetical protein
LESLVEISLVFPVHPSEEVLEEYAFGRLNGDHLNAVDDHLLVCETCQAVIETTDEYIRLMKTAVALPALKPRRRLEQMWNAVQARVSARSGAWVWVSLLAFGFLVGSVSLSNRFSPASAAAPLQSYRGGDALRENGASMNAAPASRPLDFTIRAEDVPSAPSYRLEVVTETGKTEWSGDAKPGERELTAHMNRGLPAGLYWVRLYGQQAELLSEFGLRLK